MTEPRLITAYVTKYALTQGILKMEGEKLRDSTFRTPHRFNCYFHSGEWFENWLDAVFAAQTMKKRKINSLQKQLTKLENLTFTEPQ